MQVMKDLYTWNYKHVRKKILIIGNKPKYSTLICNPNTQKAETGGLQIPCWQGIHIETPKHNDKGGEKRISSL